MSADNYMLVRKVNGRYAVTMEFASEDAPGPVQFEPDEDGVMRTAWFDALEPAIHHAASEWTEYGIEVDVPAEETSR